MSDIDELRQKRMQELQQRSSQEQSQAQMQQDMEMQKKQIMMQILTTEARSRLTNLRLTKPDFVEQIEIQLIQLVQSGRVQGKITDEQLKNLLKKLSGTKREINISRK